MDDKTTNYVPHFASFTVRSLVGIFVTGILSGVIILAGGRLLDRVLTPVLCREANQLACSNSDVITLHIAAIVAGIISVAILVKLSVYRPLLVAIAVTVGLWQLSTLSIGLFWPVALLVLCASHIMAYVTFSWILRIYNLFIALLLTVLVVAGMLFIAFR